MGAKNVSEKFAMVNEEFNISVDIYWLIISRDLGKSIFLKLPDRFFERVSII